MTNDELIARAEQELKPYADAHGRLHGDVAAALVSEEGKVHVGVCVDTPGWGLCAERSAIAAMITDGEYKIAKIVTVWKDKDGKLYVLPPCGTCRQFMRDVDEKNLEAEVVLGRDKACTLKECIPYSDWSEPLAA